MVVVETYVRTAPGVFVPFGTEAPRPGTLDALEGALEISLDGEELIGTRNWDDVHTLWAYAADALATFRGTGAGLLPFPDQPVAVELARVAGDVRLTVRGDGPDRSLTVGEPEFVQAVRARGREYFAAVGRWFPDHRAEAADATALLLRDPDGSRLADVPWRRRLDGRQAAAIDQAERSAGRKMAPAERERLIEVIAGRRATFEQCVERITAEWLT